MQSQPSYTYNYYRTTTMKKCSASEHTPWAKLARWLRLYMAYDSHEVKGQKKMKYWLTKQINDLGKRVNATHFSWINYACINNLILKLPRSPSGTPRVHPVCDFRSNRSPIWRVQDTRKVGSYLNIVLRSFLFSSKIFRRDIHSFNVA